MKKRFALLWMVVLLTLIVAGTVFAHDKGDLMLNIEPQIGLTVPNVGLRTDGMLWTKDDEYTKISQAGGNLGLNITAHYYFIDYVALNAGVGFLGNVYNINIENDWRLDNTDENKLTLVILTGHVTIPFGVRFSASAFAGGLGLIMNIPVMSSADWTVGQDSLSEKKFTLDPFAAWYVDVGFDMSGVKGAEGGFGMVARVSAPFSNKIAKTTGLDPWGVEQVELGEYDGPAKLSYDPFKYVSVSLVFQAAIQLGNFPIGGKK